MRAMSYGFMVWSVDTLKIRQVVGSKDDKLRRMIGARRPLRPRHRRRRAEHLRGPAPDRRR
jgi:hypothetical protein